LRTSLEPSALHGPTGAAVHPIPETAEVLAWLRRTGGVHREPRLHQLAEAMGDVIRVDVQDGPLLRDVGLLENQSGALPTTDRGKGIEQEILRARHPSRKR
jgi:hypothetical protein